MAQFGRHLYGTSLFGKSNAFLGTYDTRKIDVGEPFDGAVRVRLDATLPSLTYTPDDRLYFYDGPYTLENETARLEAGSSVSVYLSGKNMTLLYTEGQASVSVEEQETGEVRRYTTDGSGSLALENFPEDTLQNYTITITADSSFAFEGIRVQTTEIQGWVRATTEEKGRTDYFIQGDWPLSFETEATEEHDDTWLYNDKIAFEETDEGLEGATDHFYNVRYVQLKLILLTTDSETAPAVHEIQFYSGDMSKFRSTGHWRAVLDMENIAADQGVDFERVTHLNWVEKQTDASQFDLHSSSRNGNTPSHFNILDDSYWSDVTAKYTLKDNENSHGVPYGRISLTQRNNGYSESARQGNILFGPVNPLEMGFTNTDVSNWHSFVGHHHYPRHFRSSFYRLEFYENKTDLQEGVPSVAILDNPDGQDEELLNIASDYGSLYVRLVLHRDASFASVAVDGVHLYTDLSYESPRTLGQFTDTLSPLDGYETNNTIGEGRKLLRRLPLNTFDWPRRAQTLAYNRQSILETEKEVRLDVDPVYLNQVYVGLENPDNERVTFTTDYPEEFEVHSQTYAETPPTHVHGVDAGTLYWHYNYDGGSVNFPVTTYRELSTQYTPSLLEEKSYRYLIENGWSDETFKVPLPMTYEEIADITRADESELFELNENIPLYDGKVLAGYSILIPNHTLNPVVSLAFESNNSNISDQSLLNGTDNDRIAIWIEESDSFEYLDWTSDEVLFKGIINYNDEKRPYIRVQNSAYNVQQKGNHTVSQSRETALEIASRYNVDVEDLLLVNDRKEVFERNEVVVIPGGYSLPDIAPGLIYEGDHPYVVEVIPGSVKRTKGHIQLEEDTLRPGSDDEPALSYTLTESNTETVFLRRGAVQNGRDHLPVSNVIEVHDVVNYDTNERYVPATSSMGDYLLEDGHIDWSPSFSESSEPNEGELYQVTLTRGVVDTLRIVYTSDYVERMSQDRMEALPVHSERYQVDLREDMVLTLPPLEEMQQEYPDLKNLRYVAENSDLWVTHEIEESEIRLTLNGEDPNVNWYPTLQTGFYYLNDQEHYLYSRPVETVFDDKDIPVIRNVSYTSDGLKAPTS